MLHSRDTSFLDFRMEKTGGKLLCFFLLLCLHFCAVKGEVCVNNCVNGTCVNGSCQCNDNWSGSDCSIFVCQANNPCLNEGTCSHGEGNRFECSCPDGYGGTLCECNDGAHDISLCPADSDIDCGQHGTCKIDLVREVEICVCEAGWGGELCDNEVDRCLTRGCGIGTCTNTYDVQRDPPYYYNCSCPEGYSPDTQCDPIIDYCYYKPCVHGNCSNAVPIVVGVHEYICTCEPGYTGVNCSTPFSHCDDNPCQNGATCNELPDHSGYTCSCLPFYTGNTCYIPYDPCENEECYHNGVCQSHYQTLSPGEYKYDVTCNCTQNFTGSHCQMDVDECSLTPACQNDATCINTYGGFLCHCPPGLTGDYCEVDINDCDGHPCQNGGMCTDGINSFSCDCNSTQFTGPTCNIPLNETCHIQGCQFDGKCQFSSSLMKPVCDCQTGFSGDFCLYKYQPCSEAHCNPEGTLECFKNQSTNVCQCRPGYSSPTCSVSVYDSCAHNQCFNGGTCMDVNETFQCSCLHGFSGRNCEVVTSQDCQSDLVCKNNGSCLRLLEQEFCQCPTGWGGQDCSFDIDECYQIPCKNGGTCRNTEGGYQCICPTHFGGDNCETLKLSCDSNPCQNGGTCMPFNGQSDCSCAEGYEGVLCEKEVCPHSNCTELANDGKCDWHCFNLACNFDGGEDPCYTKSGTNPWANCSVSECKRRHNDGYCDQECNNAKCLYDGSDCSVSCGDSCNVPQCPSDTALCGNHLFLPNYLILIIASNRSISFEGDARKDFLNSLGRLIHGEVELISYKQISRNELAYEGYQLTTLTSTEQLYWRLVLRIDIQNCIAACPTSIQQVLNAIQAAYSSGDTELGEFGVVDALSGGDDPQSGGGSGNGSTGQIIGAIVGVSAGVVLVIIVALVLGKRVRDNGGVKESFKRIVQVRGTFRIPGGSTPEPSETNLMTRERTADRRSSSIDTYEDPSPSSKRKSDGSYPHFTWTQMEVPVANTSSNNEGGGGATCVIGQKGKDNRKWSYLHCEAARPSADIREVLGQNGTMLDVNTQGPGGLTPLMIAIMAEDRHRRNRLHPVGSVRSDSSSGSDYSEYDPIMMSYSPKFPRMFSTIVHSKPIEAKVPTLIHAPCTDVNITNDQGETALHLAVKHGRDDYIHYLLMAKADPNIRDRWGKTPLHVAIGAASDRAFQILIDCSKTNLELKSKGGITPLMLAVKMGNNRMVQQLIAKNAEITGTDSEGRTAVHWAAMINNVEALKLLIKQGPDNIKDAPNLKGETALFLACREGSLGSVRHLLDCYANATLVDSLERSPLQIAYEKQNFDVIEMLQHSNQGPLGGPSPSLYPMKPPHSVTNPMFNRTGSIKMESSGPIPSAYPQSSIAPTTAGQSNYHFRGGLPAGGMTRYPSIEAELERLLASTTYPELTQSFLYQPHLPNTSPGIIEGGVSPGHSIISPTSVGVSPGDSNQDQTFSPQTTDMYAMSSHTSPQAGQVAAYSSANNPIVSSTSTAQVMTGSTPLQHLGPATYADSGAMLPTHTTAELQGTPMEPKIYTSTMQSCNGSPPMAQTVSPHPTPLTMAQATTTNGYSPAQVSVATDNNSPSSHYGFPSPPKEAGEYGKYGGTAYNTDVINSLTPSPEDGNSQHSENSPLTQQQQQQYTTIHGQYTYTSDPYSISLQPYNTIRMPQIPGLPAFNPKESTV